GEATMYCTHSPCYICAKMIVNAGIRRMVSFTEYADDNFPDLFRQAGIVFDVLPVPDTTISRKP
ncbi:MAG: cytidine deaminase, partial [Candidatus Glassbacteria bacterium]|nr:cytidine deaminase [Candidatus Glassbacteria bacterium]